MKRGLILSLAAYSGTSYYFLKHPEILHRKKEKLRLPQLKEGQTKYLIAHRGGSCENPENTLQAFQHSVELGVHVLETDVRLTKDGQLVTFHDVDFYRMSNKSDKVCDTNLDEMPLIQDKLGIHFSRSEKFQLKPHHNRQFTTLENLLLTVPKDVVVQIEIKDQYNQEALQKTIDLIKKHGRQDTTIIGTQNLSQSTQLHKLDQEIPLFIPGENAVKYMTFYFLGLLPFVHIQEDSASFPYMTRDYLNMKIIEAKTITWKLYPYILATMIFNYFCEPMIKHLNQRGVFTNYWVLNDDDEIRRIIRHSNIMGIMSDRPARLAQILREENDLMQELKTSKLSKELAI
ncbi:glycerophosphodiester phosphodiesterase domain-containing protein 1 [Stylonychia lemnae]|uniref:Glycerophosphodiester phosphodiesterase domain-containing protein 1 n=1 Tax=Stylonychia lemnae TaxID=5949 RepID=A0A077ZTJ5_STYLE|nr:glycerophosphodiester phosphodiesterase domain-containing protein 1 [Stylonychia lemnae]|eukprot:CDW73207.1 glycerophosphodiester phosphodiesterase domain-containing protein 1 [Stylonychia lemnae]